MTSIVSRRLGAHLVGCNRLGLGIASRVGAGRRSAALLEQWTDQELHHRLVTKVNQKGGPDYVVPKDRLATFDNDGTLWIEQPIYTQFAFAVDEVKAQANKHPTGAPRTRSSRFLLAT